MTIIERAVAPTPKFFKTLRAIGLALLAIAATLLGIENLAFVVVEAASYVAVVGMTLTVVSQLAVDFKALQGLEESEVDDGR
jgi:hypothetical protein